MKNGPLRGCFISPTMSAFMFSFSPVHNGVTPFISSLRTSWALATSNKGGPAPATCDEGGHHL